MPKLKRKILIFILTSSLNRGIASEILPNKISRQAKPRMLYWLRHPYAEQSSRLFGHDLNIVIDALTHTGEELARIDVRIRTELGIQIFRCHEAVTEFLESGRVLVTAGPGSRDLVLQIACVRLHYTVDLGPHLLRV